MASLNWQDVAERGPEQRLSENGAHWTWTPETVTPHSLPPEVLTTLSEPGWPRAPNDLLSKTLKLIEQPATGRVSTA